MDDQLLVVLFNGTFSEFLFSLVLMGTTRWQRLIALR